MKKMYVLIRKDLDPSYQAVQAGHALAQFMLEHPDQAQDWDNHTLIYLRVKNEDELKKWWMKIDNMEEDAPYSTFREPDIGNELTAIATYGNGELYRKLRLL